MAVLSGVALVLASIGAYGVMAYAVAQQRQEIGIRLAPGATRSLVIRFVLRRALLLTVASVVIGIAAALPLSGMLGAAVGWLILTLWRAPFRRCARRAPILWWRLETVRIAC